MVRYVNFATLVLLLLNVADSADATQQVRGSRRRLLQQNPCVLVQRHVLFKHPDSHSESERHVWACKLQGDDVKNAHARIVELDKAAKAALHKDPNIRSGHTTLMIDGAEITEDKTLKFPKGISITQHLGKKDAITSATNSRRRHHHRRGLNEVTTPDDGPHKVLAIRVEAKDSSTTASKNRLGDDIFGLGDDQINLSSRFDACSYGQLLPVRMGNYNLNRTMGQQLVVQQLPMVYTSFPWTTIMLSVSETLLLRKLLLKQQKHSWVILKNNSITL